MKPEQLLITVTNVTPCVCYWYFCHCPLLLVTLVNNCISLAIVTCPYAEEFKDRIYIKWHQKQNIGSEKHENTSPPICSSVIHFRAPISHVKQSMIYNLYLVGAILLEEKNSLMKHWLYVIIKLLKKSQNVWQFTSATASLKFGYLYFMHFSNKLYCWTQTQKSLSASRRWNVITALAAVNYCRYLQTSR